MMGRAYRIFVDVGHGGSDPGCAVGIMNEADYNLSFSLHLRDSLRAHGFDVLLSRETDSTRPHADRGVASGVWGADLVLVIHVNADPDPQCRGGLMCYWPGNGSGLDLATRFTQIWPLPCRTWCADDPREDMPQWKQKMNRRIRTCLQPHEATAVLCELFNSDNREDMRFAMSLDGQFSMVNTLTSALLRHAEHQS